jgi:glycosyltransferase involved in cell wall biosynthesis
MSVNSTHQLSDSTSPKITILTTSFPRFKGDNAGKFIYEFARELNESGCSIHVIAPHDSAVVKGQHPFAAEYFKYFYPESFQSLAYGAGIASRIKRNGLRIFQFPFFILSFFMLALKKSGQTQIFHAYWMFAGLVALSVKLFTGIPVLINLWGSDILFTKIPLIWNLLAKILNRADGIVCESRHFADQLISKGISSNLITIIPNGINLDKFIPQNKKSYRANLGLHVDRPLIITIGNLSERKGHKYLINALPEILKSQGPIQLVIIGEGELRSSTESMIAKLEIDSYVYLAGFQKGEMIPHWLNAADVFVLPSLLEGTPNVLLEAMACQLAIVSTSVGGIGNVLQDGQNGFIISAKSSADLADRIILLLKDSTLRQRLGENARKTVFSKYSNWKKQSITLKKLYLQILDRQNHDKN